MYLPCYHLNELIPELLAHATVNREVQRAGQAGEGIDGEHNVVSQLVIHPFLLQINLGKIFLYSFVI